MSDILFLRLYGSNKLLIAITIMHSVYALDMINAYFKITTEEIFLVKIHVNFYLLRNI